MAATTEGQEASLPPTWPASPLKTIFSLATSFIRPSPARKISSPPPGAVPLPRSPPLRGSSFDSLDLAGSLNDLTLPDHNLSNSPSQFPRTPRFRARRPRRTILYYDTSSSEHDSLPNSRDEDTKAPSWDQFLANRFGPEKSKLETPERPAADDPLPSTPVAPLTLSKRALADRSNPSKIPKISKSTSSSSAKSSQPLPTVRRRPTGPAISPLPPRWEVKVDATIQSTHLSQTCATTPTGLPILRSDLITILAPGATSSSQTWLNDAAIDAYLQLVVAHGITAYSTTARPRRGTPPRLHAFTTHFYSTLRERGPQAVHSWCAKALLDGPRILQAELIFIPVHQGAHWTLLVISPQSRTIEYFDSLNGSRTGFVAVTKRWLAFELGDKWTEAEWKVIDTKSPQQRNGFDCGVFLSTTAKMVMLGLEPSMAYGQADIQRQRRRMVAELINGGFGGDLDPKA